MLYFQLTNGWLWDVNALTFVNPQNIAQEESAVIPFASPSSQDCVEYLEQTLGSFEREQSWFNRVEYAQYKALKQLKETRLAHEYAGPLLNVNGDNVRFPSDVKDETRLNSLALMFNIDPTLVVPDWKIADGVYVAMTAPLLAQIRAAGSAHIAACFSVERGKREEILAMTDPTSVQNWLQTNLEIGWPE